MAEPDGDAAVRICAGHVCGEIRVEEYPQGGNRVCHCTDRSRPRGSCKGQSNLAQFQPRALRDLCRPSHLGK